MNFEEALAFLDDPKRYGSDTDPSLILEGLEKLGNPQNTFRIIHIAGTNGKGSTGTFIASILKQHGESVGHFTSPHVLDFTERIRIDGHNCERDRFARTADTVQVAIGSMPDGENVRAFTLQLYAALVAFREAGVDFAVVEAGIGGTGDATNILMPILSVITPIGLDHMPRLGRNLVEIAENKAGIIKEGVPVVSAPQVESVTEVLQLAASRKKAPIRLIDPAEIEMIEHSPLGNRFIWKTKETELSTRMAGSYQAENAVLATTAVLEILPEISLFDIQEGIEKAFIPGRRQWVRKDPYVIIDGAHNRHAIEAFAKEERAIDGTVGIIGMMEDKQSQEILDYWRESFERLYLVPVDDPRSWDTAFVKREMYARDDGVRNFDSLQEAVESAVLVPGVRELYIMGSLYLAGEALAYFE